MTEDTDAILLVQSLIRPVSELRDVYGCNMLLYGPFGAGKTTLAASAQDSDFGKNVLFLDTDGGLRSILKRDDIDFIDISVDISIVPNVVKTLPYLKSKAPLTKGEPIRTLVIDSFTEFQAKMHASIAPNFSDGRAAWGEVAKQLGLFVRRLRDISHETGINTIFVCNERGRDNEEGIFKHMPELSPGVFRSVARVVDDICHLDIDDDKGTRKLSIKEKFGYEVKFREALDLTPGKMLPQALYNPVMDVILRHGRER